MYTCPYCDADIPHEEEKYVPQRIIDPFDDAELAISHPARDVWSGNADTDKYWRNR